MEPLFCGEPERAAIRSSRGRNRMRFWLVRSIVLITVWSAPQRTVQKGVEVGQGRDRTRRLAYAQRAINKKLSTVQTADQTMTRLLRWRTERHPGSSVP